MISGLQGTPGSGKSAVATSMALDHLREGGVVAANFSLFDGWAETVAARSFKCRWLGADPLPLAQSFHDRYRVVRTLDAVWDASKNLIPKAEGKIKKEFEGHGLLILDEAQLIFNSRVWAKNFPWIEFFSQHRKLKWNVLLIAHSLDMIDSQIRYFIEYDVRYRNMNKVRVPFVGIPLTTLLLTDNLFLSIWRYYGISAGSGNIFKKQWQKLCFWEASLYDSMKVFSEKEYINGSLVSEESGPRPAPPEGGRTCTARSSIPELRQFFDECNQQFNKMAPHKRHLSRIT